MLIVGKLKKVGIGIGVFIAFLVILFVVSSFTSNIELRNLALETQQYMPDRNDIGTEWAMGDLEKTVVDFGSDSIDGDVFESGIVREYRVDGSAFSNDVVTVAIYKFDSEEIAQKRYDSKITSVYEKGGFVEETNVPRNADVCYGTKKDVQFLKQIEIRCVVNNIYIYVKGTGSVFDIDVIVNDFAQSIINKI